MKRPMAVTGACAVLSLAAFLLLGTGIAIVTAIVAAVGLVLCPLLKNRENRSVVSVCFVTVICAFIWLTFYDWMFYEPAKNLCGKEVNIEGEIVSEPYRAYGQYYTVVKTENVNGEKLKVKIRLSMSSSQNIEPGDKVTCTVKPYLLTDSSGKNKADGVFIGGYMSDSAKIESCDKFSLSRITYKVRNYLLSNISYALPGDEGELLKGMLLGDKTGVPEEINESFRHVGLSHLFAVSGLHLSIWVGLFSYIKFKRNSFRVMMRVVSALFILFFMAVTGFTSSVFRAGVMTIVFLGAQGLGRKVDGVNSLGLAAVILCMMNPYTCLELSFLLSFSATLGILICYKPIERLGEKVQDRFKQIPGKSLKWLITAGAVSISASIFTFPVSSIVFGEISAVSPFANLIVPSLGAVSMISGGLAAVFPSNPIFFFITKPLFLLCGIINKFIIRFCLWLGGLEFSHFRISSENAAVICAGIMVIFAVTFMFKNYRRVLPLTLSLCLLFAVCTEISETFLKANTLEIIVCDSGESPCIVLSDGKSAVIVGGGSGYNAETSIDKALSSAGTEKINAIAATKYDNIASVESIASEYDIPIVINSSRNELLKGETDVLNIGGNGESVEFSQKVKAEFYSDFTVITYNNFRAIISYNSEGKISSLPGSEKGYNLLICSEKPPADYENFGFSYIIVTCDEDYFDENKGEIYSINGSKAVTGEMGNITVFAQEDGSFRIRRSV